MKSLTRVGEAVRLRAGGRRADIAALLRQGFEWAYDRAVAGAPGIDGAEALAARYGGRHANAEDAVRELILWQSGIAGAAGFVTGCGGFAALPVALPANLASALYIQARLIAAIARLRGHDLRSDEVRTTAFACLAGSKAAGTARDAGVRLVTRVTRDAAGWASPVLLKKARHAGHATATACEAGARGAARFGRFAPLVGGVVAGAFDAAMTQLVGRTADRVFAAAPAPVAAPPVIDVAPIVIGRE